MIGRIDIEETRERAHPGIVDQQVDIAAGQSRLDRSDARRIGKIGDERFDRDREFRAEARSECVERTAPAGDEQPTERITGARP